MIPKAAVAFRPARRHEDCRVCNQLSAEGDCTEIIANHTKPRLVCSNLFPGLLQPASNSCRKGGNHYEFV